VPNPTPKTITDVRSLARSHTEFAVKVLAGIAKDSPNDGARVAATVHLLDRGWGKPEQVHSGTVDGDIRITIRQILDGDRAKLIEGKADDDKPE
jgi:hypothetical protein